MAYEPKTWVDRVTENPNRRLLTATGIDDTYDVTRAEGIVTEEGDKINATNLNGLESRVNNAFLEMGINALTCTTSGTVHALTDLTATSGIVSCIFKADANYVAGDTFTIGGTAYTIVTSGGEALRSGAFLSGDIVSIKLDITNTKLYIRQESTIQVGAEALHAPLIEPFSSPSQLTHPGRWQIGSMTSDVNANAGTNTMSDYATGDFHAELLAASVDSTFGCQYGTLIVTSPRLARKIWIGTIWNYQFAAWQSTLSADYASGLNPETAPCLVNTLVLPYRTSTVPTGLPDGTFVFWKDEEAP